MMEISRKAQLAMMTQDEKKAAAARLLLANNQDIEAYAVYEDENLGGLPDDELNSILDLMSNAKITISWPDAPDTTWSNKQQQ